MVWEELYGPGTIPENPIVSNRPRKLQANTGPISLFDTFRPMPVKPSAIREFADNHACDSPKALLSFVQ